MKVTTNCPECMFAECQCPPSTFLLSDKGGDASGDEGRERAIALDAKGATEGEGPKWIQIARVGQWAGHPAGMFQLGAKEFGEIVANFKATKNRRIPIDFEHVSEMDPREGEVPTKGAPAQGWMIDLDNRGKDGLWALAEWKEPARSYIREGKYMFFSPTIRFNARDPQSGERKGARLSSGALTNQPFLDGMMPVAAKDTDAGDKPAQKDEPPMLTAEQIQKLIEEKTALSSQVATLTAEVTTLKTEAASVSLSLKDATAKLEKAETEVKTLSAEKAKRDEAIVAERVDLAFATYKDEKKLTDDDKEAMRITLSSKPDLFEKLYPKAEAGTPHMLRNLTGDGENATPQRANAKPEVKETIVQMADRIQKEKGVNRDQAFAIAERELKVIARG